MSQAVFVFMSIISFSVALLPLSVVIDKVRNDTKDWSIALFCLQFGVAFYNGLFFFIASL